MFNRRRVIGTTRTVAKDLEPFTGRRLIGFLIGAMRCATPRGQGTDPDSVIALDQVFWSVGESSLPCFESKFQAQGFAGRPSRNTQLLPHWSQMSSCALYTLTINGSPGDVDVALGVLSLAKKPEIRDADSTIVRQGYVTVSPWKSLLRFSDTGRMRRS